MGARAGLTDDVREVRYALGDAWKLCDALGLLDGPRSSGGDGKTGAARWERRIASSR